MRINLYCRNWDDMIKNLYKKKECFDPFAKPLFRSFELKL